MNKKRDELMVGVNELKCLETLDGILLKKHHVELVEDKFMSVEDLLEGYNKSLKMDEFKDSRECLLEQVNELRQYVDKHYYVGRCEDINSGIYGQGFAVVDMYLNYIGFVRTV